MLIIRIKTLGLPHNAVHLTYTSLPSPRNANPSLAINGILDRILRNNSLLSFFVSPCCLLSMSPLSEQVIGNTVTCSAFLKEMEPSRFLNLIVASFQLLNPLLINDAIFCSA